MLTKTRKTGTFGEMSWCNNKTLLPCSILFLETNAGTHRTSSNPSIIQPQHIHPELSHTLEHNTPHSSKHLLSKSRKKCGQFSKSLPRTLMRFPMAGKPGQGRQQMHTVQGNITCFITRQFRSQLLTSAL